MWHWRQITHGLRTLWRRDASHQELADEVRHWLEQAEAELIARGATPQEARRNVRLRYGDGLAAREDVGASGWETLVEDLHADVRLAARRLRRSPGFTVAVTLILGLGIGAATAILSAASPVLFEPLNYPEPDRILSIADRSEGNATLPVTFGTFLELRERSRAFESLAVFNSWLPTLTGGPEPERLEAQRVSAGYFDVLGVRPALGRGLDPAADRPGGTNEVVLSDGLWRRRFAADPGVIGRPVDLDSESFVVVGVMPVDFENVTFPSAQAWAPLQYDALVTSFDTREWGRHLEMAGRLREGLALDEAREDVARVAERPIEEFVRPTWASMSDGLTVRPLRDTVTAGARPTMVVLTGAVGLLLAIACVNLTILLLARGLRRREELAMRAALGAGRARLVRQLLTESLMLAALGGVFAIAVARLALGGLVAVSPPTLPRLGSIGLDATMLVFALGLTTTVGLVVGLAPALVRSGRRALATEKGAAVRHQVISRVLVVTEVALAVMLLVGAGLLMRSTARLLSTPTGFDPASVVVMQVYATGLERGDAATHRFWNEALDAVRGVPGVREAVLTSQLPLSGDVDVFGVTVDEANRREGADGSAYRYAVSPGYFEALGIDPVRGRTLEEQDRPEAPRVAVVSESLSRRLFQDRDPLGRSIRVGAVELPPYTIVGVVDDVKQESLAAEAAEAVYVTPEQWHWADRVRWIIVRADGDDPSATVPAIRRAVWSVDRDQPVVRAQSLQDLVRRSEAQRRFVMTVLLAFALAAATLAGLGLYGVLSGSVTERRHEIGIRAALGASREHILVIVVRRGMALAGIGMGIGLVGASVASALLASLLFETSRADPLTYAGAVVLLGSVSAVACWLPASRAARVDPLATLKTD